MRTGAVCQGLLAVSAWSAPPSSFTAPSAGEVFSPARGRALDLLSPLRMHFGKSLLLIAWVGLLAGCGEVVVDADPAGDPVTLGESKSRWSFELPGDGTPNNNSYVGPFCCSGETAIVKSDDGKDLGYAYFFGWKGQAYFTSADTSGAPDLSILVAGLTDIKTPSSSLEKGEVDFMADEMIAGSSRSTQAGDLVFTVTVEHAELQPGPDGTMFDMGSLAVRVDVDPVE